MQIERGAGNADAGALNGEPLTAVIAGIPQHVANAVVTYCPFQLCFGNMLCPQGISGNQNKGCNGSGGSLQVKTHNTAKVASIFQF